MTKKAKKVLVIDDSQFILGLVQGSLEMVGVEVLVLETALGSTSVVAKENPDLILVDINLPALSGEKFTQIIRKNQMLRDSKIILYSDQTASQMEAIVAACGADGYITKAEGTEVLVNRVLAYLEEATAGQHPEPSKKLDRVASARTASEKPFILAIDDSEVTLESIRLSLEPAGFEVMTVSVPKEAMNCIAAKEPAVVLVDINMPEVSGEQLIKLIKSISQGMSSKILLHSYLPIQELEAVAQRCGADGYVQKTGDPDALLRQVSKWLPR